jgi:hypothetical protein
MSSGYPDQSFGLNNRMSSPSSFETWTNILQVGGSLALAKNVVSAKSSVMAPIRECPGIASLLRTNPTGAKLVNCAIQNVYTETTFGIDARKMNMETPVRGTHLVQSRAWLNPRHSGHQLSCKVSRRVSRQHIRLLRHAQWYVL